MNSIGTGPRPTDFIYLKLWKNWLINNVGPFRLYIIYKFNLKQYIWIWISFISLCFSPVYFPAAASYFKACPLNSVEAKKKTRLCVSCLGFDQNTHSIWRQVAAPVCGFLASSDFCAQNFKYSVLLPEKPLKLHLVHHRALRFLPHSTLIRLIWGEPPCVAGGSAVCQKKIYWSIVLQL